MTWQPPRCCHGYVILGCPHDDCPTQIAFLDQQEAAMRDWERRQDEALKEFLGLPPDMRG